MSSFFVKKKKTQKKIDLAKYKKGIDLFSAFGSLLKQDLKRQIKQTQKYLRSEIEKYIEVQNTKINDLSKWI